MIKHKLNRPHQLRFIDLDSEDEKTEFRTEQKKKPNIDSNIELQQSFEQPILKLKNKTLNILDVENQDGEITKPIVYRNYN